MHAFRVSPLGASLFFRGLHARPTLNYTPIRNWVVETWTPEERKADPSLEILNWNQFWEFQIFLRLVQANTLIPEEKKHRILLAMRFPRRVPKYL